MRLAFWLSLTVVAYAYVGYAVLLVVFGRLRSLPVRAAPITPGVSVILAAHNEEANLPRKLQDLYRQDYPSDRLEVIIVSDGSTDGTNAILDEHRSKVKALLLPQPGGKALALNAGVSEASGDILVFMDARQSVDHDAISKLVACFADPMVGAVSGELLLESPNGGPSPDALGIYWEIEKLLRKLESATGSVVGATGALFAMRRSLFVPLPPGTLLDDVLTPLNVARAGKRVLFLETAIARDRIFPDPRKEFGRKVRTLTGNYQLLQLAPWLLSPGNPLLFRFISHKLLRLLVPFLLIGMLVSCAFARGTLYRGAFLLQLLLYVAALTGALFPATRRWRLVSIAYTFVMLNVAAGMAFYNFIAGRARWA